MPIIGSHLNGLGLPVMPVIEAALFGLVVVRARLPRGGGGAAPCEAPTQGQDSYDGRGHQAMRSLPGLSEPGGGQRLGGGGKSFGKGWRTRQDSNL